MLNGRKTLMRRKVRLGIECNHNYPIATLVGERGRRACCLGCWAVGPVCESYEVARQALLATLSNQRS